MSYIGFISTGGTIWLLIQGQESVASREQTMGRVRTFDLSAGRDGLSWTKSWRSNAAPRSSSISIREGLVEYWCDLGVR